WFRTAALPWLVLGPFLLIAGALVGRFVPALGGGTASTWQDPVTVVEVAPQRLPSLAGLVDGVRDGIVRITTFQKRPTTRVRPRVAASDEVRYSSPTDVVSNLGVVRGTGFLVHERGLVVTCHHVIAGHASIKVELSGQRFFDAQVVGEDAVSDLAVLRLVDPPEELKALPLGDSAQVRQGDWAISLGNPFEFGSTLGLGLITYVGRHLTEGTLRVTSEHLQFSAPVNPGDSGAPLIDMSGNVIGLIRRTLTGAHGISFGVPSKAIKGLLGAVQRGKGRVRRGYLGMEFRPPRTPERVRGFVQDGGGAEVTRVIKGHPADVAGVAPGDVIVSYDGQPVTDAAELYDRIIESPPGYRTPLSVLRRGQILPPLMVTVGEVGRPGILD
ncbi:MAG: trypsin-like peptidase domain-containing protein, partial [Planctomycetes bacterium]|nr:trypsin-like peptidase domain-containing protein [Planctomycetota bacterium]